MYDSCVVVSRKMLRKLLILVFVVTVTGYPYPFETSHFRVGVEYEHSLPMNGGSDRYRHRNNYEPFFVTISATAKNGYVIAYLDVTAIVDESGDVKFNVIRGTAGAKTLTFQLVSNNTDFLSYSYLAYGIKEAEYKKITNVITIPIGGGSTLHSSGLITTVLILTLALLHF